MGRSLNGRGSAVVSDEPPGHGQRSRPTEGDIHVLLVDDNEQWARFVATELEEYDSGLVATVVHSANEAMSTLRDSRDVDCVVADYQMPEIDGLQLLERIQEERPGTTFIMLTGEGSEDVASRAIDSGVSDYMVKDPRSDQTSLLVKKIRTAVTQDRLYRAIREGEERYRTVIERTQDSIAILQDGELVFWNQRLCELVGTDDASMASVDFLSDVIHSQDRDEMSDVLDRWHYGDGEDIHETRLITADGEIRYCECTGGPLTEDGVASTFVSIRDVTERERRERELAWERELNRTVKRVLVESRTREQLEREIAEQLSRHWYAMAWVGDLADDTLVPRAVEGDTTYLESLDLSTDSDLHDTEPSLWAVRSGEAKFVPDFEDLFTTEWQRAALDCGYHSGAAVPLVYNDVTYGVLAVYHEIPNRFDETERDLLTDLGDTIAFAIHNIETEAALASDHSVEMTVHLRGGGYYLTSLAQSSPVRSDTATLTVHGTIPKDDGELLQFVTLEDIDLSTFTDIAAEIDACVDVTVVDERRGQVQVRVCEPTPEAVLAGRGVVVRTTEVRVDGAKLTVELPAKDDARQVVEALEEHFGETSIHSIVERDADADEADDRADLTDKQAAALQAAYHHGYFDQPRTNSATEVAEALDVTHSTFLYHLRAAQRKVFGSRFA